MSGTIPPEFGIFVRNFENFTSNRFKLEAQSGTTGAPGNIVSVLLPDNSIIDLKSLRFLFDLKGKDLGSEGYSVPGNDIRGVIQSLAVFINGVAVEQNMPDYNTLVRVLETAQNNTNRRGTVDNVLSNGIMYAGTTLTEAPHASYCIDQWRGFLGENTMRYIDTSLFGSIQIRITLAPGAAVVCPYSKNAPVGFSDISNCATEIQAGNLSYELTNIHFTVDCISLGFDYGRMLREAQQNFGVLPVNYREYYNYPMANQSSTTYTNRFQLGTQSLNALYGITRPAKYDLGGVQSKDYVAGSAGTWAGATENTYAVGDTAFTNGYYTFPSLTDISTQNKADLNGTFEYFWNCNNVQYPQTPGTAIQAAADLTFNSDKNDVKRDFGTLVTTMGDFKQSKFIVPLRLAFNDDVALMSGYNTRGINSSISLTVRNLDTTLANNGYVSQLFASTTATLRAEPGKALAISF